MLQLIKNERRFYILRGYFQEDKYYSQGGKGLTYLSILRNLRFKNKNELMEWYSSLTPDEVKKGKKDWCSGPCCQSILWRFLGIKNLN